MPKINRIISNKPYVAERIDHMMYESLRLNVRFRTLPKIKIDYILSRQILAQKYLKYIQIQFGVPIIYRPIETLIVLPFIAITKLLLIATMIVNTISMSICAAISNISLIIINIITLTYLTRTLLLTVSKKAIGLT